ncbi:MAG: hypothetical protein R3F31_21085 [Verrucomicrobiales bacterium]
MTKELGKALAENLPKQDEMRKEVAARERGKSRTTSSIRSSARN